MKRFQKAFVLAALFGVVITRTTFAATGEDVLKNVNTHLQPQQVQDAQQKDDSLIAQLCRAVGNSIPFICEGYKAHEIFSPQEVKKEITQDEVSSINTSQQQAIPQVTPAVSGVQTQSDEKVLGLFDSLFEFKDLIFGP